MPDRGFRRARFAAALGLALAAAVSACAPPPPPAPPAAAPAPPAERLGPTELDALATLLRLADTRSFDAPFLAAAASSRSPTVRRHAALGLGRLRRAEGVPLLARLVADVDTSVAATAAFALGLVGDTSAVALLAPILADSTLVTRPTVGVEAAQALGTLPADGGRRALGDFLARARVATPSAPAQVVAGALLAVWKFPDPADSTLVTPWLQAPEVEIRRAAAYALTRRPTPSAARRLLGALEDPDPRVRSFSLRGLGAALAEAGGVPPSEAVPALLSAVEDTSYAVRIEAIRALGSYTQPEAVGRLRELLSDTSRHAALAAAERLGELGEAAASASPELERLTLDDGAPDAIRAAALGALVRVAPARARPTIDRAAASPSWRLRAAAAESYARLRADGATGVQGLVLDRDPRVAAAAFGAMVQAGPGPLRPPRDLLISALGHPDVMMRAIALQGLWDVADPATLPLILDAFQRAQNDSIDDAALAALDALTALRARGAAPERALFARFARPSSHHLVQRAVDRFGDAAVQAWGPALPLSPTRAFAEYHALASEWVAPAGERRPRVVVTTGQGSFEAELFADRAPLTVENFLSLARSGYFDGQEWPRVVPNFVAQGGDPRGDSSGGPGYTIRDEINRSRYGVGTLGMALSGPDTGGSQFFVTHSPQPHLDGTYTVFGRVVSGQHVVERLLPGDALISIREVP